MVEDYSEDKKVVWNFDDAEAQLIFDMKLRFLHYIDKWDLENSYWSLLTLLSESEPLFEDTVKEELNNEFIKISNLRTEMGDLKNISEENKSEFFLKLMDFYRDICEEIVNKDYYFRKKRGYTGL